MYGKGKLTIMINYQLNKRNVANSARKVPEITAVFWVAKLLTTAMGEATSDFLVFKINQYLAVTIGAICLAIALALQFRTRRYVPWVYWLCVSMVAVFGTMAADGLHVQLGVPYIASTLLFAVILCFVFIYWQRTEKTLSIHSITTRHREMFYWATVLSTFALGTAVGDLTATSFGLGYFSSILLFLVLIAVPAISFGVLRRHEILTFWTAYVLTRPLGASVADWLSKSKSAGSLNWGDGHVSIMFTIAIVVLVIYMSRNKTEISRERHH